MSKDIEKSLPLVENVLAQVNVAGDNPALGGVIPAAELEGGPAVPPAEPLTGGCYDNPEIKLIVKLTIVCAVSAAVGGIGGVGFGIISDYMELMHIDVLTQVTMGSLYELVFALWSGLYEIGSSSIQIAGALAQTAFRGSAAISRIIPDLLRVLSVGGPTLALGRYANNMKKLRKDIARIMRRIRRTQGRAEGVIEDVRASTADRMAYASVAMGTARAAMDESSAVLRERLSTTGNMSMELLDVMALSACRMIDRGVGGYSALHGVITAIVSNFDVGTQERKEYAGLPGVEEGKMMAVLGTEVSGRALAMGQSVSRRLPSVSGSLSNIRRWLEDDRVDVSQELQVVVSPMGPEPPMPPGGDAARGRAIRAESAEMRLLKESNPEEYERRMVDWLRVRAADLDAARAARDPREVQAEDDALAQGLADNFQRLQRIRAELERLNGPQLARVDANHDSAMERADGVVVEIPNQLLVVDIPKELQLDALGDMPPPPPRMRRALSDSSEMPDSKSARPLRPDTPRPEGGKRSRKKRNIRRKKSRRR